MASFLKGNHHQDFRLLSTDSSQQCEELPGDLPSLSWLTTVDVPSLQQRATSRLTSNTGAQSSMLESQTDKSCRMNTAQGQGPTMCPYSYKLTTGMNSYNTQNGDMTEYPGYQYSSDLCDLSPQQVFSPAQQSSPTSLYNSGSNHSLYEQHHDNTPYSNQNHQHTKTFPKPMYSYSCLIAMALKNSQTGSLPVSEIYGFMKEHFPYFMSAPEGWKNSVRHNLSLNKCFQKVVIKQGSSGKGCLWSLNPAKIEKMEEEMQKWKRKDLFAIRSSMANPDELDKLITDRPDASQRRSCWDPRMSCVPCNPGGPPVSGHRQPLPGTSPYLQAQTGPEPGSPLPAHTPPLNPFLDFSHSPIPQQNPYQNQHSLHSHHPDFTVEVDTSFIEFAGCLWEEMREEGYNLETVETVGFFNTPSLCVSDCELTVSSLPPEEENQMEDLYTILDMAAAVSSQYITT